MSEQTKYPCPKCDLEFGAPATLRIHYNHCEVVEEEPKVVEKVKKSKKK